MPCLRHAHTPILLALFTILMTGCGSCDDRAVQMGEYGNLRFYYEPADLDTQFNRPIATGSELTLYVQDPDQNPVHQLISVQSNNPDIISATTNSRAHNAILLNGQREGKTKIEVHAKTGKGTVEDLIEFNVLDPREISLQHACTTAANAAYLVRAPIQLDFTRKNKGRTLVGQSRSCSVQVEPAEILPSTLCDEINFHLPSFDSFGSIRLTPELSNAQGRRNQLGVQIVDRKIVDFLPLEDVLSEHFETEIEILAETMTEPYWPVCHNFVMEVVIETPRICEGANENSDDDVFTVSPASKNRFSLRGLRRGECIFSIVFPEISTDEIFEFSLPVDR